MKIENHELKRAMKQGLAREGYDILDLVPTPASDDRMVRLRTLQEVLSEFDSSDGTETISYLIQIKRKINDSQPVNLPKDAKAEVSEPIVNEDEIYKSDGSLNADNLLLHAETLLQADESHLARNIFRAILKTGAASGSALMGIAKTYVIEGAFEKAIEKIEEAIAYQPTAEAYRYLTELYSKQGKDEKCAEVIERAIRMPGLDDSVKAELYKTSGNCWTRLQNTGKAIQNYEAALSIQSQDDELRCNLASVYLQCKQITEAEQNYLRALDINATNANAFIGLASCALAVSDKARAFEFFQKSLKININNPMAIFYLVKIAYEIKKYDVAAKLVEEYIEAAPMNANLLYSLAGLQFHLGNLEKSKQTCSRVLEVKVDHEGAKELLNLIQRSHSGR